MKLRATALCGAALAGTLMLAGPALAQRSYYDTNPTPAERAQTDQLNSDASDRARSESDDDAAATDANTAAQSDYNQRLNDYDAQRATYDRDRARYHAEHADYAHRWDAFYGHDRFRDVGTVPERDLMGLSVSSRGGSSIGRIRDVDFDARGGITRVAVSTGGDNVAWIDADDVRYDPQTRTVMSDLSRDQVGDMAHMRYPRF
ncbi:MAG: PRC-barrel domain-containing protein [Rhizomicrobium sp.]